jgi:hypothetical protein
LQLTNTWIVRTNTLVRPLPVPVNICSVSVNIFLVLVNIYVPFVHYRSFIVNICSNICSVRANICSTAVNIFFIFCKYICSTYTYVTEKMQLYLKTINKMKYFHQNIVRNLMVQLEFNFDIRCRIYNFLSFSWLCM